MRSTTPMPQSETPRGATVRMCFATALVMVLTACGGPADPVASIAGPAADRDAWWTQSSDQRAIDALYAGNAQAVAAAPALVPPGVPLTPFIEARLYAMTNAAMHDALNAIDPEYERYADHGATNRRANIPAAILTAAHDVIAGGAPAAAGATDAWYAGVMAPLAGANGLADGVAIGHRVATAMLSLRASDGVAAGGVGPFTPGTNPGDYRFTFPFNTPPFDIFGTGGFADASNWGTTVTPFVVQSASQFRAPRPYGASSNAQAVKTARYTADYNEIAALGCDGCSARSAEQTEIAKFWVENSPTGWNRIARIIAQQERLDAHETARLFALLQLGEFDSYTTSLESKYYYRFWRPVTAVELAGTDGNAATTPVAGWQVVVFPTPPVPDFPSAHAEAGGTAAQVIEDVVGRRLRPFTTTSGSLPGPTRQFTSVAEAARENADSRVFVGYHFRHATDVGLEQGRAVGRWVTRHALRPLDD